MIQVNLEELKQIKLKQLKYNMSILLTELDYVITKISEAQLLNNTAKVEALKQKYSLQLQKRENIRAWAEQVKQAIQNAKTVEELNSIEVKYNDA